MTTELSAELWIRTTTNQSGYAYLLNRESQFSLRQSATGSVVASVVVDGQTRTIEATRQIHDGDWHHVALTYDGQVAILYVDGDIETSAEFPGTLNTAGSTLVMGNRAPNIPSSSFAGEIDEVAVFGEALDQSLIRVHAQQKAEMAITCESTSTYGQTVCGSEPAGYWQFDESSGTKAADTTQPSLHGSFSSGVTLGVRGAVPDAERSQASPAILLGITGTHDPTRYVEVPWQGYGRFTKPDLTAEVWARTNTTGNGFLFRRGGQFWVAQGPGGVYQASLTVDGVDHQVTGETPAHDGAWHHLAVTFDGHDAYLYLDGKIDGHLAVEGKLDWATTSPLYIGNLASNSSLSFAGELDEAAIYGRALAQAEIQEHSDLRYVATVGCSGAQSSYAEAVCASEPVGYWRLGDTSGTVALDQTVPAVSGTYSSGITLDRPGIMLFDPDRAVMVGVTGNYDPYRYISVPWQGYGRFTQPALTAEIWAKTTMVRQGFLFSRTGQFSIGQAAGGVYQANFTIDGVDHQLTGKTPAHDGSWHHVVATYDGQHARLYIDGNLDQTLAIEGRLGWGTNSPLYIGNLTFNFTTTSFPGDLDEAAIYGRALTEEQIRDHYLTARA